MASDLVNVCERERETSGFRFTIFIIQRNKRNTCYEYSVCALLAERSEAIPAARTGATAC